MQCPVCGHLLQFPAEDFNCAVCEHRLQTHEIHKENKALLQEVKEMHMAQTTLTRALFYNNEQLILAFIRQIDIRDRYTGHHSKRVAWLATHIGKMLELKHTQLIELHRAGNVHDIGKVYVPDTILNEPGKLKEDEMSIMKKHPIKGVELLQHLDLFIHTIPVVRSHHENYDGTGYPDGLKGENIHYWARIVAIADSIDAMRSARPYRPGLDKKTIINELKINAGIQFDPVMINIIFKKDEHLNFINNLGEDLIRE